MAIPYRFVDYSPSYVDRVCAFTSRFIRHSKHKKLKSHTHFSTEPGVLAREESRGGGGGGGWPEVRGRYTVSRY